MNSITEGTWFAVPLKTKGYGVGVVSRTTLGGGIVLAYFFGELYGNVPSLPDLKNLEPSDAIWVVRAGDLGLIKGAWPVIGIDPHWRRGGWGVPVFVRRDDLSRKAWSVQYSNDDVNLVESETPIDYEAALERDSVFGAGAVEVVLTRLLSSREQPPT